MSKFSEIPTINGHKITKNYVASLTAEQRELLIEPLFEHFRNMGWTYPDDSSSLKKEYAKLIALNPNLNTNIVFNNSSLATNICKFFCKKFYLATEKDKKNMIQVFNNDDSLRRLIKNRLGMDWYDPENNPKSVTETFNISFRMLIQGLRSMRMVPPISMFKPDVAKYMYSKYSKDGDTVYDPSAGWGGRLLGAASCGRKYIGTDPWTIDELSDMVAFLKLENVTLLNLGSEDVDLGEDCVDFSFTSPPYVTDKKFIKEFYSSDETQAYGKGIDYFYDSYWRGTLKNIKKMLKNDCFFGLNVTRDCNKMVEITKEFFGEPVEEVQLQLVKSHLSGKSKEKNNSIKYEPIFMFVNKK